MPVTSYIAQLTGTLAPADTVEIRVIDDAFVNAHWFPGHLYLSTGVILKARNEAELAGAIAHLLGHLNGPPVRLSEKYPIVDACLRFQHRPLPMHEQMEQFDREADSLGVRYMAAAGYDPHGTAQSSGTEFAAIQARLRPRAPSLFH